MAKYLVRYGVMRHLAILSARGGATLARGTRVIARTSRGLEVGEGLCEAGQEKFDESEVTSEGQILREMTDEDLKAVYAYVRSLGAPGVAAPGAFGLPAPGAGLT